MKEQASKNGHPTPVEQLANVWDGIADDILDGYIDVDEETKARAVQVAAKALESVRANALSEQAPSQAKLTVKLNLGKVPFLGKVRPQAIDRAARNFGLQPSLAWLLIIVSIALVVFDVMTFGLSVIVRLPIAAFFGLLTLMVQRGPYGDDMWMALKKSVMVSVLLAVPFPIAPPAFAVAATIGSMRGKNGKRKTNEIPRRDPSPTARGASDRGAGGTTREEVDKKH